MLELIMIEDREPARTTVDQVEPEQTTVEDLEPERTTVVELDRGLIVIDPETA